MDTSMIILVPVLVLGVVGLFAFAGCGSFGAEADSPADPTTKPPEKKPAPPKKPNNGGNGTVKVAEAVDAYPKLVLSLGGATGHLRSYWRLAEVLGSQPAADSEPTQPKPGTYKGGVALNKEGVLRLGSDPNDAAVELNGTDAHVEVPFDILLNPPDAFSLEAWVRPDASVAAGTQLPIIASFQQTGLGGFVLLLVGVSATRMQAQIQIGIGNAVPSLSADVHLDEAAALDGWHHIVATFGNDGGVNKLRLFVDGGTPAELAGTGTQPLGYRVAQQYPGLAAPFRIGAGPGNSPTTFFKGRIDEVALYDAAIDGNVASHFTQATKKFKTP